MIDILICCVLTWAFAALLNAWMFKRKPASKLTATLITMVMFFVYLLVLSYAKYVQFQAAGLKPTTPWSFGGALVCALFLYSLLNKRTSSAGAAASHSAPGQPVFPGLFEKSSLDKASARRSEPAEPMQQPLPPVIEVTQEVKPAHAVQEISDASWSASLGEFDGPHRQAGLWARVFSESNGDENRAKATYLRVRAGQIEQQALSATQETDRAHLAQSNAANVDRLKNEFVSGKTMTREQVSQLAQEAVKDESIGRLHERIRGESVLHLCARMDLHEAAVLLLAHGANMHAPNGNGQTPHDVAHGTAMKTLLAHS